MSLGAHVIVFLISGYLLFPIAFLEECLRTSDSWGEAIGMVYTGIVDTSRGDALWFSAKVALGGALAYGVLKMLERQEKRWQFYSQCLAGHNKEKTEKLTLCDRKEVIAMKQMEINDMFQASADFVQENSESCPPMNLLVLLGLYRVAQKTNTFGNYKTEAEEIAEVDALMSVDKCSSTCPPWVKKLYNKPDIALDKVELAYDDVKGKATPEVDEAFKAAQSLSAEEELLLTSMALQRTEGAQVDLVKHYPSLSSCASIPSKSTSTTDTGFDLISQLNDPSSWNWSFYQKSGLLQREVKDRLWSAYFGSIGLLHYFISPWAAELDPRMYLKSRQMNVALAAKHLYTEIAMRGIPGCEEHLVEKFFAVGNKSSKKASSPQKLSTPEKVDTISDISPKTPNITTKRDETTVAQGDGAAQNSVPELGFDLSPKMKPKVEISATMFCDGCQWDETSFVQAALLNDPYVVLKRDEDEMTGLHWACDSGQREVVQIILKHLTSLKLDHKQRTDLGSPNRKSPKRKSSKRKDSSHASIVIKQGERKDKTITGRRKPGNGADALLLNLQDAYGNVPLKLALDSENFEVAIDILETGLTNLDLENEDGETVRDTIDGLKSWFLITA